MRRVTAILLQQKNFGPNVIYFVLRTKEQKIKGSKNIKLELMCRNIKLDLRWQAKIIKLYAVGIFYVLAQHQTK